MINPGTKVVYRSSQINSYTEVVYVSSQINPYTKIVHFSGCFPKSALVRISPNKLVPIESIQTGDILSSWDINQQRAQSTIVTQVHHHQVMALIRINDSFEVSPSQPLLVIESAAALNIMVPQWRHAQDIDIGNLILGFGGEPITVDSKTVTRIEDGIDVMQLSTYHGAPFFVENFLAGANNDVRATQAAMRETTKRWQGRHPITDNTEEQGAY